MDKPQISKTDAIVVGAGPNGLAAVIRLAQAGWSVVMLEAAGRLLLGISLGVEYSESPFQWDMG